MEIKKGKKINKKITFLIMGIFLLTTISALYAGETFYINTTLEYDYYSIVGNISEVNLNITKNETSIMITPNKYSLDDTYEIIFFNKEKEVIYIPTGGGGGGGSSRTRTIYKDNNVTQYKDKIIEKEVLINTPEKIREADKPTNLLIVFLILVILGLLIWILYNFSKREETEVEDYYHNDNKDTDIYNIGRKEEENKNE